ncbi:putative secreted protein (Por secretion system target) [Maribacter caenipelagi]|uniref:Putative secreted protein (Por secretion system target) n=1 Tax=Maribacter caenipelagi TaxID=1447781 RepID=A0A4R7D6I8_9FLAO|nr:T9SS type A sorting domain-containing protein [Maribacter caenipelagi]TDS15405.1 putative secreted protein (Por secretion system target) [Maribacter caenipelagi]
MEKNYITTFSYKLIAIIIYVMLSLNMSAQSEPFNCDYNAYLFQYNDIYALDLASGSSYLVAENITPGNVNGVGYNATDGYLWGYLSTPSSTIVRIGKDYTVDQYTIPELPTGNKYVGDISPDGVYFFKAGGSSYFKVDINPESATYLEYLGAFKLSQSLGIADWAFNAADGMLYTVEGRTRKLFKIDPETGKVYNLGEVPILEGLSYTFGAVYFDVDGNFYISANQTGSVYKIEQVQNITDGNMNSNIFAFGPAASSNDGARCPTAPVPQEDCLNGVDDDGDGLVDCDDPSCSGVASCPVIVTTSSANKGGLESNDRLANLISKRNFNRAKSNYVFDKSTAKKLVKNAFYGLSSKTAINEIPLNSLVPLGVVGETSTIESSPSDLLDLTNASDIYSVDYLNGSENLGSLMVIKTDDKVYEHSKFICDRFLGAQLLSVSNIQLREKDFIKSIIKQPDGSLEFALTFSARVNADDNFTIESHWNIDAYVSDTAYYNFQIWSNSVDDLLLLADEILNLLEVNADITQYNGSTPPPVFVKSASYKNGEVLLNLVNNNNSESINLEGGLKLTETSDTEVLGVTADIDGYLDSVALKTGTLFDLGFRISAGLGTTPDDLFVADAPWGLDDSAEETIVATYEVLPADGPYVGEGYPIERNIKLEGSTSNYLGVYRALSPRFAAVDLSEYGKVSFEAKGTGNLDVQLIKGDGSIYKTTISLVSEMDDYTLSATDFKNDSDVGTDFSDIKVLSFNLVAENGYAEEKSMTLQNIDFHNRELGQEFVDSDLNKSVVYPNPMIESSSLFFYEEKADTYQLDIYSLSGRLLGNHHMEGESIAGQNEIVVERKDLAPGLYLYKLKNSNEKIWSGRLLVR